MNTLVFAAFEHDPLVQAIIGAIQAAEVPHILVGLDPNETEDPAHEGRLLRALDDLPQPFVIGGFSLGARIAAKLCPTLEVHGLLCLAYPFHRAKSPSARHGLDALSHVTAATRIIQGTRDNHGTEAEVRGYRLPPSVEVVWLQDGNHRFLPRERSGFTEDGHIAVAAGAAVSFMAGR